MRGQDDQMARKGDTETFQVEGEGAGRIKDATGFAVCVVLLLL
jgi:hypothetical protein